MDELYASDCKIQEWFRWRETFIMLEISELLFLIEPTTENLDNLQIEQYIYCELLVDSTKVQVDIDCLTQSELGTRFFKILGLLNSWTISGSQL